MRESQFFNYNSRQDEPCEWSHPVDLLEPELTPADQIRHAQLMAVHMLNDLAVEMLGALTSANPVRTALTRLFGIGYAMGLSICDGVSMTETADRIGCERASISKVATSWNISHDLAPAFGQKSVEANAHYAKARREVVQSNGSNGHKPMPIPPARHRSV